MRPLDTVLVGSVQGKLRDGAGVTASSREPDMRYVVVGAMSLRLAGLAAAGALSVGSADEDGDQARKCGDHGFPSECGDPLIVAPLGRP